VEGQQWLTRLLLLCLLQDIMLVAVDNPRTTASPGTHGVRLLSCMQSSALQQQQQQLRLPLVVQGNKLLRL
jgi:hypothetical protein